MMPTDPHNRLATIITSMPGFGHLLAAELLAATNGALTNFGSADRVRIVGAVKTTPARFSVRQGTLSYAGRCELANAPTPLSR